MRIKGKIDRERSVSAVLIISVHVLCFSTLILLQQCDLKSYFSKLLPANVICDKPSHLYSAVPSHSYLCFNYDINLTATFYISL